MATKSYATRQRSPIPPGEILLEEFMKPHNDSQNRLARDIDINPSRINDIVHGRSAITAAVGLRLAKSEAAILRPACRERIVDSISYPLDFSDGMCEQKENILTWVASMNVLARVVRLRADAQVQMACEDNLEFMRRLRSKTVKLILTSPPYNIGKAYERRDTLENYVKVQTQVISECVRLLHDQGSICWQVGNHVQTGEVFPLDIVLYHVFKDHGLKLRNRIIWHFEHGLHCSKCLSGRHETILWFTKADDYTFNLDPIRVPSKYPQKKYFKGPKVGQLSGHPLGKNPGDVWIFPNVKNNHVEKTDHPCQFPVELAERLVLSMTNTRDVVFDPYMGVGSTVIGAIKHGRIGYGCDIQPEYVEIAWTRVHHFRAGTLKTRPMDRPIYDPNKPYGGHK